MAEDTNIYIKGYTKGKDCIMEITDAGKGMSEDIVETIYKKLSGEIERYTKVKVTIPLTSSEEDESLKLY